MGYTIIKGAQDKRFTGCDFVVQLSQDRKNTKVKILQLTDMQVIDSSQCRTPDRLRADEMNAWSAERFDEQCGNHIRSLIAQTQPDLILITGDIVYGSFDDSGSTLQWFCALMDSFQIPWAPVFGNHDNECKQGVAWQCACFENSPYCLFARGEVSGNSNYTVGIAIEDTLLRVIHMLDSNGCWDCDDPSVIKSGGIYPDQVQLMEKNTASVQLAQGKTVPAFMACHIPVSGFEEAELAKGYKTNERNFYCIGVDTPAKDGDFGFKFEPYSAIPMGDGWIDFLHAQHVDGVFVGHVHNACTCIHYQDIKWVFGLKTGQYDYHIPGQLGGTLITLENDAFTVTHVPALVHLAPMPGKARMFNNFFAKDTEQ